MSQSNFLEDSNLIDLSQLTIIFITRNRQHSLLKNVLFFLKFEAKIVILDGSDQELSEEIKKSFFAGINYIYSTEGLEHRMKLARSVSLTDFTIISTDDDLFVPSALHKAIVFLKGNPKVLSCSGRTIGFIQAESELNLLDCYPENDQLKLQLTSFNSFLRVVQYLFRYSSRHFYSVYRSRDWDTIFTSLTGRRVFQRNYLELIIEFRASLKGSHYILTDIFWLRNFSNSPIRAGEKYRNFAAPREYAGIFMEVLESKSSYSNKSFVKRFIESCVCCIFVVCLDILNLVKAISKMLSKKRFGFCVREDVIDRPEKLEVLIMRKGASANLSEIRGLLSKIL